MMNVSYSPPNSENRTDQPMSSTPNNNLWKEGAPRCSRCCGLIYDQTLISADDKFWHKSCFRCTYCHSEMNDACFSNGKEFYCRQDFERLFGIPCAGCSVIMDPSEIVRRVYCNVYHERCFVCALCHLPVQTGEKVYLRDDNKLVCTEDYEKIHSHVTNNYHDNDITAYSTGDRSRPITSEPQNNSLHGIFQSDPKLSPQMRLELSNFQKSDKMKTKTASYVGEWLSMLLSPDSVPPNVDLSPQDIRNGEVCISSLHNHQRNSKTPVFSERNMNWMCL